MKTKNILKKLSLIGVLFSLIVFNSCKKEEEQKPENNPGTVIVTVDLEGTTAGAGVVVDLYKNNSQIDSKTTDAQGKVTFDDVEPGDYQLRSSHTYIVGHRDFTLHSGETKQLTLSLGST